VSVSRVIIGARTTGQAIDRVLRYPLAERINHWIAAFSYIYCLITGLGFWSPYMFWLTAIVGGGPTARFWHPWLGLVFTASLCWMYARWRQDMLPTDADRVWWERVDDYVRNEDEKLPAIGRFNYGQKLYFWVTFWATILLLLSGLLLWFPEYIAPWLRSTAVAFHVIAALVTIGVFIIHVYMGTAMVKGSFTAMVTGYVPAAWARFHHRLWYEQLARRTPQK